ncbi:iron-sulfur cluster repair di-iron protein [Kaistella jeonii]|uniref:Iron-sulfur cluster repair di-iron protein n=1 Tax=Kaistella jeonii TaxID=266749 RepID=A0A0C1FA36_9FLAO|nr:iron-sulfur cluster repair di-iron protein [Kaistella jeonii]KIA88763.1 iron-sulfur cluster repair di-iron protein [Kaistella jeonii]SFC40620.1 regulator of cell morphogenesis and NO signaling [Kaistella jeonii]VEI97386.1 Regulator of cell morphogenesis and NO signaling [Kaistella jeonii]
MLTKERTIGEMVAEDFKAAEVFRKYKIDFCCKGNRTIEEACENKKFNVEDVYKDLENISKEKSNDIDFNSWPLDLLADYVEKTHHRYVEENTAVLLQYLSKLCKVHGDRHPELFEIYDLFKESATDLGAHMKKEELILFPFIKKMVAAKAKGETFEKPHFGSVESPVAMMKHEHTIEGDRFVKIAELTNNYQFPDDACGTYQVTYKMLEDFENDLHKHIHLENNILFPKAIELEKTF